MVTLDSLRPPDDPLTPKRPTPEEIKLENKKLKEIGKGSNLNKDGVIVPEQCGTCRFSSSISGVTICRYYPPKETGFPKVDDIDWCGKYKYDGVLR